MKPFQVVFAVLLAALSACGKKDQAASEKVSTTGFFEALSFDLCLQNPLDCFKAWQGDVRTLTQGLQLVKLLPNSSVFEPVSLDNLRAVDRKSLIGAAILGAASHAQRARKLAVEHGFAVPPLVALDPLCTLPLSQNNSFFRSKYGFGTDTKTELTNVLCLGKAFVNERLYPLATDGFVVSHEFFHVLMQHMVIGTDKVVTDEALSLSHDLDAFNEGSADYFAERLTGSTLNRLFALKSPWRTSAGRKSLPLEEGVSGLLYRDAMRWTEVWSRLGDEGLDALACTTNSIGIALRRARSEVRNRDEAANLRTESGALIEAQYEGWAWDMFDADILGIARTCSKNKETFDEATRGIFPALPEGAKHATMAKVAAVLIPDSRSLCAFSKQYGLKAGDLRKGEILDPCAEVSSIVWNGGEFSMAKTGQAKDTFTASRQESVYVLLGAKLLDGFGTDCRIRGATAPYADSVQIYDSRDLLVGEENIKFSAEVFANVRGSWYRDVPLGNFLPSTEVRNYALKGPLSSLSEPEDLGGRGFRFVPFATENGNPTSGLNGLFWLTRYDYRSDDTDREGKLKELATWAKATLLPYRAMPSGEKCQTAGPECALTQNYSISCRSAMEPMAENHPLPEVRKEDLVWIRDVEAHVFDCSSDEEASCVLKSF